MHPHCIPLPLKLTGTYVSSTRHFEAISLPTPIDLAWAAGFFDGEGCTYLGHHGVSNGGKGFPAPCAEVNQIDPFVLNRFQAAVAGVGSVKLRKDKKNKRWSPMWSFYTRNWRMTQVVLSLLWPYLSEPKIVQATRVFAEYQQAVDLNPRLGRPNIQALWTETSCPRGHTDIDIRIDKKGYRWRRCRVCRKDGMRLGYNDF